METHERLLEKLEESKEEFVYASAYWQDAVEKNNDCNYKSIENLLLAHDCLEKALGLDTKLDEDYTIRLNSRFERLTEEIKTEAFNTIKNYDKEARENMNPNIKAFIQSSCIIYFKEVEEFLYKYSNDNEIHYLDIINDAINENTN